jgi:hypothetical protein
VPKKVRHDDMSECDFFFLSIWFRFDLNLVFVLRLLLVGFHDSLSLCQDSQPAALTAASQDLLGAVAKVHGASDFEQSAQAAAQLPDLMTALLSAELGRSEEEEEGTLF